MIFVVGNSRSGTTMMGRVMGQHSKVFMFHELHFFEQLWNPAAASLPMGREQAVDIVATLLSIQRAGYLAPRNKKPYLSEACDIVGEGPQLEPAAIYRRFLLYESRRAGAQIPCEQTPRNLFYAEEIMALYPDAHVVEMVRDPRDVLLSQKHRWRRRSLGKGGHTKLAALRSWANYHPYVTTKIWLQSVRAGARLAGHERSRRVRYEDLVDQPEKQIRMACANVGLDFEPAMLAVPRVGSSTARDSSDQGISDASVGRWRQGGLTKAEIWVCQRVAGAEMDRLGYARETSPMPVLALVGVAASLPLKMAIAVALNIRRIGKIRNFIARRLDSA